MLHHIHIIKRAMASMPEGEPGEPAKPVIPIMESTLFIVLMIIGGVYFTLWHYVTTVFMTLTVVESAPSVALDLNSPPPYTPRKPSSDPSANPLLADEEAGESSAVLAAHNKRVTSGVISTFKHLRSKGGIYAPLRGFWNTFHLNIFYGLGIVITGSVAGAIVGDRLGMLAGTAIATILTARWNMALTQLRIASPESNKITGNMFKRAKKMAWSAVKPTVATLVLTRLYQQSLGAIMTFFVPKKGDEGFDKPYSVHFKQDGTREIEYVKFSPLLLAIIIVFYIGFIAVVLPAKAVLVRMQASGLPAEDDTIVPVDKTFGVEAAGERTLTFVEAAKTFSKDDIKTIFVMGLKLVGLETIQLAVFASIVYWALFGLIDKTINNVLDAQFAAMGRGGNAAL